MRLKLVALIVPRLQSVDKSLENITQPAVRRVCFNLNKLSNPYQICPSLLICCFMAFLLFVFEIQRLQWASVLEQGIDVALFGLVFRWDEISEINNTIERTGPYECFNVRGIRFSRGFNLCGVKK